MPNSYTRGTKKVLQRIGEKLAAHPFKDTNNDDFTVTSTFGVVNLKAGHLTDDQ